jgi:hypothetical protein
MAAVMLALHRLVEAGEEPLAAFLHGRTKRAEAVQVFEIQPTGRCITVRFTVGEASARDVAQAKRRQAAKGGGHA